jgi:EAL domain-containing protein (putative c-di-GMP-specific phosphodiesterase class I)
MAQLQKAMHVTPPDVCLAGACRRAQLHTHWRAMLIGDLHFLVVEDHPFQRAVLLHLLGGLGAHNIRSAADGRAAMELLQSSSRGPDVIITDVDMPRMDGMEFLRHLGQAARPVSVIVTSAAADAVLASVESMARAYGVHSIGVLRKPVTREALAQLLGHDSAGSAPPARATLPCRMHAVDEIARGLDKGQFEPYFQPQLELATGRLRGLEALARWRRPGERIIVPAAFIPALERVPVLMNALTWQMLAKSAVACGAWRKAGLETCVSVNITSSGLADVHFADRLVALLRHHDLKPCHLTLEVTESAAVQLDCGATMESVARLRVRGFGLACDDFGTGYASLDQLARLPFTELKIDQGFLRKARDGAAARIILRSTLEMANRLQLVSVGEGVQTQQEWDLLRELGGGLAQGYFIAPAMEAAAVVAWWRQRDSASAATAALSRDEPIFPETPGLPSRLRLSTLFETT